jgi:hypothetical protein
VVGHRQIRPQVLYILRDVDGVVGLAEMTALRGLFATKYPTHRCDLLLVHRPGEDEPGPFWAANGIMFAIAPVVEGEAFWRGDNAAWNQRYRNVWAAVGGFREPKPLP